MQYGYCINMFYHIPLFKCKRSYASTSFEPTYNIDSIVLKWHWRRVFKEYAIYELLKSFNLRISSLSCYSFCLFMGWDLILETEDVRNVTMEIELLFYRWYVILNPSMTWWNFKFSCFNYFREEVNIREIFINRKWPHYRMRFIIYCPELLKMFWYATR